MSRMVQHEPEGELLETLSLYALGLLDPDETAAIERHLAEGCPPCEAEIRSVQEALGTLGEGVALHEPPAALRSRVMALASGTPPLTTRKILPIHPHIVQRDEGVWRPAGPGLLVKILYIDRDKETITSLLRMEAGASYAPHRHAAAEQCLVLEGDVRDGTNVLHAGDFQTAPAGSIHGNIWTEEGCLLLLVSSLRDEILST